MAAKKPDAGLWGQHLLDVKSFIQKAAIRECARLAEECGVILGVQNHHDVGVGVDAYVEFLDEVDHANCRAMFDPWSVGLDGEDLTACAKRLAPRMVPPLVPKLQLGNLAPAGQHNWQTSVPKLELGNQGANSPDNRPREVRRATPSRMSGRNG